MAKTEKAKATQTAEEKAIAKKERLKNKGPRENFLTLASDTPNTRVRVQHIRGFGCHVETTVFDGDSEDKKSKPVAVSTYFVMGAKPKSKSGVRFLVKDNGPKPKKDKADKAETKAKKKA